MHRVIVTTLLSLASLLAAYGAGSVEVPWSIAVRSVPQPASEAARGQAVVASVDSNFEREWRIAWYWAAIH